MYSSRGSNNNTYGQQSYSSQSAYSQAEGDIAGYRAQSSATTHYGGQYGSGYGSGALGGILQGTTMSAKLAAASSLEGRGGYAAVSDSPKFAAGDFVSSGHGYGHKGDSMYSDKIPDYPSVDSRQYAERRGTYVGRELQNEPPGRYTESIGFSRQHQPEIYDRIDQAALLRQEQLLKAQSLQSASLEGGSRQSDLLAARSASGRLSTQDLVSYGGRIEVDPHNAPMFSTSAYGGQHASSILSAAPRRNIDEILYAQSSTNPGYGVSLPPGRDYGSGKGVRSASIEGDYPGTVLSRASHATIDEHKSERASYLREFEVREEERRRERLRDRDREREREREKERERERERRRDMERLLERRERERDREVKRLLESRRERTPARTSRDRRGSSLLKEGKLARQDSPRREVLHRRHSPIKEKRREYICKVYSSSLVEKERDYMSLDRRYPRLFISPECAKVIVNWPQGNLNLSLNTPVSFEHDFVEHEFSDGSKESSAKICAEEGGTKAQSGSTVWNAKIILMSGLSRNAIEELSLEKTSSERIPHMCNILRFAVMKKDRSFMAIGGPWDTSDGGDPAVDDNSLIRTALRYAKDMSQLDLTHCHSWNRFLEIHYDRVGEDGLFSHKEVTVLFVPDLSECLPSLDAWREQWVAHKKAVAERERQLSLRREKSREREVLKAKGADSVKDGKRVEKSEIKNEVATSVPAVGGNKKDDTDFKGNATEKKCVEEGKDVEKNDQMETSGAKAATTSGSRKKIVRKVRRVKVVDKKSDASSNGGKQMETDKIDAAENVESETGGHQVPVSNSQNESKSVVPQENSEGTEMGSLAEKTASNMDSNSTAVKKKNVRKVIRKVTRRVPKKTVTDGKASDGATEAETPDDMDEKVAQVGSEATNVHVQKGKADGKPSGLNKSENEGNKAGNSEDKKSVTGMKVQEEVAGKQAKDNCDSKKEKPKDGDEPQDEKRQGGRDGKDETRSKSNKEDKNRKKIEEVPRHPGFILQTKLRKDSKFRSMSLSLDSLLDYTDKDIEESTFEVSLFAESLYEMLHYQMGSRILTFLQKLRRNFMTKRNQRKRQRDETHEKKDDGKSPTKRSKNEDIATKMESANSEAPSPTQPGDDQNKAKDDTPSKEENEEKLEDVKQENEVDMEDDYEEEDPEEDPEEYPEENGEDADMPKEIDDGKTAVSGETEKSVVEVKDEVNQVSDEKSNLKALDTSPKLNKDTSIKQAAKVGKEMEDAPVKEAPVDKELLQAFHFFDRNRVGYIRVEDMRLIIHNLGKFLSYRDVKELVQSALLETNTARDDRIIYRKLVRMTHL